MAFLEIDLYVAFKLQIGGKMSGKRGKIYKVYKSLIATNKFSLHKYL